MDGLNEPEINLFSEPAEAFMLQSRESAALTRHNCDVQASVHHQLHYFVMIPMLQPSVKSKKEYTPALSAKSAKQLLLFFSAEKSTFILRGYQTVHHHPYTRTRQKINCNN